ncbi:MAG: type II toxin-antitoxin system RelE/ParE family toxin [Hydrogenophaga sp.]|jgi:plasmid stabilization system protein ParE|nr:type II toxin-antitoxin system RelE/ParE family toxin [Hydrogenophaga sp.]MDO9481492.1 type II toxin-antitoxin system RelE/ParE family toxin [Hydrogenophaga sp.]MDP1895107.1 type II toxin-antitoxin system RelE/ParE family toxin [Hydrogenophaga sp.]MDP2096819.1 type II toxin-antitoxin system RelE/ParE family toxin [Hydrogenophaga sp.]MDP2222298.1 type II toxin-antitoxin system RelE/ParE family toxin [Hydrogenophaga sp.]
MKVLRKPQYLESLQAIEDFVAKDNPTAAVDLWLTIDDQVSLLADPNFPRRRGRVSGTLELVAHPNYVVILVQAEDTVTAIDVLHVARQYP